MTTFTKYIVALVISLLMMSCIFDSSLISGIEGNGNLITQERPIDNFNQIKVSRGLQVYLTQSENLKLVVEADENLHDIIMTKVQNKILHIYADENIRSSKAKKVMVNFNTLENLKITSGSHILGMNNFKLENIAIDASSGGQIDVEIDAKVIECDASSGSLIKLTGSANTFYADASSGSSIRANDLQTKISNVEASSGANIRVNSSDELVAKATSGANVKYYGNPIKLTKKNGVSGSINKD